MGAAEAEAEAEGVEVADDLVFRKVPVDDLREQDVNAHTMSPRVFERLTENIRQRGQLESAIYCAQPNGKGPVEIVSGHHRTRAARAAGLDTVPALIDVSPLTRSQVVAKQLAHNALVGNDDPEVLKQLVGMIENPDDLLASGLPNDLLPGTDDKAFDLFMPRVDFDWQTISFAALPHQVAQMEELCERLQDRHDVVLATMPEQFDAFVEAAAEFARLREVRSGGTVLALLTEIALANVAEEQGDEPESTKGKPDPTPPAWTKLSKILGKDTVPTESVETIERALAKAQQDGHVGEKNRWQLVEYLCADYLAGN